MCFCYFLVFVYKFEDCVLPIDKSIETNTSFT